MIAALAGGVGAARFLRGLVEVCGPEDVVAVVNTADDIALHGLRVSPDLDTVLYTLAGAADEQRGWGLAGETWTVMESLERYRRGAPPASAAGITWFRLGDRDLATHLYRTQRLAEGAPLSEVTAELTGAWGVGARLLPMTDDPVATRIELAGGGEVGFQEYFVEHRHALSVGAVRFAGAQSARPAPGVIEALESASTVVICPSNPILSVAPILAVPGIEPAVAARREAVTAISPIVAGAALRGPADRLMAELGHEPSVVGVARMYTPVAGTLVVDESDARFAAEVEREGMRCVVTKTVMHDVSTAAALAAVVLEAGKSGTMEDG